MAFSLVTALSLCSLPESASTAQAFLNRDPTCAADAAQTPSPQLLHQIHRRGEVLPHSEQLRATWMKHNPGWSYRLWDEAALSALVNESYPWFVETFHALPTHVQREDAGRYLVLHAHGGIFADADVEAIRAFGPILEGAVLQIFEEPSEQWEEWGPDGSLSAYHVLSDSLISVAQPGHPLLLRVLRAIRPLGIHFARIDYSALQDQVHACREESDSSCGCFQTVKSADFFPSHAALKPAMNFSSSVLQLDEARRLAEQLKAGEWPPATARTVRWKLNRVDRQEGGLLLDGLAAVREGREAAGDTLLRAFVSSQWGRRYKYFSHPEKPDLEAATKAYEKAMRLAPEYAWPHYELGNLEMEKGQHGAALQHFRQAVSLSPDEVLFHNNLGVCEMNLGKHAEAEATFRRVLELHGRAPHHIQSMAPAAGAHFNLGMALNASSRAEEAIEELRFALHGSSSHFTRLAGLRLRQAGALELSNSQVGYLVGSALLAEGRTREAAMTLARAHELTNSTDLHVRIAERMRVLADFWHVGAAPGEKVSSLSQAPQVQYVRTGADGSTARDSMGELTPELWAQIKEGKVTLPGA